MVRVLALVEGQTEEEFVKRVLQPYLADFGVSLSATMVTTSKDRTGRRHKGGGHWGRWQSGLRELIRDRGGAWITTFLDLYGLPSGFPEKANIADASTADEKIALAEAQLATEVRRLIQTDRRVEWFIPHVQRHELEALVLARLDALRELLDPVDHPGLDALIAEIGSTEPEDVNDGIRTAPSKRLERHIPSYQKTVHGPLVAEDMHRLRERCPHFRQWVDRLAALGAHP